jgi:hypothetical protein
MITQGTRATITPGTEIDRTVDMAEVYIEVGKTYSGYFNVTGLLSGNESQVMDAIEEQIRYPSGQPDAAGVCEPTYIEVDSASGTAYAEWRVSDAAANSYRVMLAPIVLAIIILSIVAITILLIAIALQKATEFVAAAGPDFTWIAIAAMLAAGAVIIIAATYGYGKVVSGKPIMEHYNDYRGLKNAE